MQCVVGDGVPARGSLMGREPGVSSVLVVASDALGRHVQAATVMMGSVLLVMAGFIGILLTVSVLTLMMLYRVAVMHNLPVLNWLMVMNSGHWPPP